MAGGAGKTKIDGEKQIAIGNWQDQNLKPENAEEAEVTEGLKFQNFRFEIQNLSWLAGYNVFIMSASGPSRSFTTTLKALLFWTDSLDTVELVMVLEETFDLNPDAILQDTSTMHQIVDAFWQEVAGKIPNSAASQLLKKIAIRDNRSSLESQADEPWRKEQVEAALEELMARRSGTH